MATIARHHGADSAQRLPITAGKLADFSKDPLACMRSLQRQHGDLAVLREGQQDLVFAFGPHWNQRILSDAELFQSRFFATRGPRNSAQRRLTSGLLSMNGDAHRRQRRLLLEPFSLKSIAGYVRPLRQQVAQMLDQWTPGETRDIHRDMTRLMLGITSAVLFGLDRVQLALRIGRMLEVWVEMNHAAGIGALVPDDKFSHVYEELLLYSERLETEILRMIRLRRAETAPRHDVLSLLIRSHDEQGGMTDEELIGQTALLFGAAHLTTASTLTWTLLLLAQHPQVMRELHDELQCAQVGSIARPPESPHLDCLDRVIKESMRVLPASAYLPRVTSAPATLGPLALSRGTPVIFSQYMTHHLPELYDNPSQFFPQRWKTLAPSPYAYLPFSAGARMCLGAPMAMVMLRTILPMILTRFRFTAIAGAEYSAQVRSTMLLPATKILLQLDEQDGEFERVELAGNIGSLVDFGDMPADIQAAADIQATA